MKTVGKTVLAVLCCYGVIADAVCQRHRRNNSSHAPVRITLVNGWGGQKQVQVNGYHSLKWMAKRNFRRQPMAFCQDGRLVDDRRSLDRLGITDGTKIDVLFTDSDVMHFFRGIAIGVFEEDGALEDVIQFLPPSAAKETARLMDVRDRSLEEGLTREITEFTQEDDATPSSAGTNVSYSAATEPSERPLPRLW